MNQILFTDLDGTLLTTDKTISPYTRQVLDRWCQAENKLVLCSGRPLPSIQEVKETLSLNYPGMYLCANNGGCIYECDTQTMLLREEIPLADCRRILAIAEKMSVYCHTYSDTHILSPKDGEELAFYRRTIHLPAQFAKDPSSLLQEPPCKCLAISLKDTDRLEALRLALTDWADGRYQVMYSNPFYLEIFPATAGKGSAVKKLCERLQIPLSHALAAGDQENDISMLEVAGIGIGMQNGTDRTKKAATIITEFDNDHDGLAMTLATYLEA